MIVFGRFDNAMRLSAVTLAIALACASTGAQQVSPHARNAVETIRQLRSIGLPEPDELDLGPPPKVPGLLRRLNQELRALIVDDLNNDTLHAVPDENEILDQLRTAGWDEIPEQRWNAYGEIERINFDWQTGYTPGILIVSTHLWIPCGSDDPNSTIYVFQGAARHFDLLLSADSDFSPVGDINGSGMEYGISPPDSNGRWFLVVAHSPPSCREDDAVLRYKVLRPGATPDEPVLVLDALEKIDGKFHPPFAVDVHSDWFAVTEGKARRLDGETGVSIFRYQVNNDRPRRIAPLALAPEDFFDQWVQLGWNEASQWTHDSPTGALETWHSKLSGLASDSAEFESVHPCSRSGEEDLRWVIELSVDQELNPSMKEDTLYIEVAKRNGNFSVESIATAHPKRCEGKTPLSPVTDESLPGW